MGRPNAADDTLADDVLPDDVLPDETRAEALASNGCVDTGKGNPGKDVGVGVVTTAWLFPGGAGNTVARGVTDASDGVSDAEDLTDAEGTAKTGIGVTKAGVRATSTGSKVVGSPGSGAATGTSACVWGRSNSSPVVLFFSWGREARTGSVSIVFEFPVVFNCSVVTLTAIF